MRRAWKESLYLHHLQKGGARNNAGTSQRNRKGGELHVRACVKSLQSPLMMIDLLFVKTCCCLR